jgi:cytochrome c oxidase subunit 2
MVDLVYDIITWISIFFFVGIVAVMVYFVIKYRRRSPVMDTSGPTHNTPLEVTWTIIPLILSIAIFYVGLKGYVHMTTPPENAYEIQVTGQRWFWTFNYPNGASETNILHVPVGRPVKLTMRSDDVIHSVFIPAFRVKQDVVPGRRTQLWFEATRTGDFDLFCAEYCGRQHSQMVGRVMVYDPDEFEVVIEEAARWIDNVPDDKLHLAGTQFFNQCASCHTLDGSKLIAPSFKETYDLYAAGGTRTLADGSTVTVDEDYIRNSVLKPLDQVVDTYPSSMPPGIGTQLGDRKVEAIVQFIMQLDETAPNGQLAEVTRAELTADSGEPEGE